MLWHYIENTPFFSDYGLKDKLDIVETMITTAPHMLDEALHGRRNAKTPHSIARSKRCVALTQLVDNYANGYVEAQQRQIGVEALMGMAGANVVIGLADSVVQAPVVRAYDAYVQGQGQQGQQNDTKRQRMDDQNNQSNCNNRPDG